MRALKEHARTFLALIALTSAPVGLANAQVTVTAADPSTAPQGTVSLDVTVSGSGFDSSAAVDFLVTGTTNPGGITVKRVSVKGPKRLIATIDIADNAIVNKFDIEVTLSSGRKGKGTTLFAVQAKANDPCAAIGLDFPAFIYVQSTGLNRDIRVADSTAACHRLVVAGANSGASRARFSYPVGGAGNVGRVAYMVAYESGGIAIVGVDFVVIGTAITVGNPYTIVPAGYNKDSYDLSPDGQKLYYSTYEGDSGARTGRLLRVTIPEQLNTEGTEVHSQPLWSVGRISVSHDGAAVYSSQFYRENTIDPAQFRLARIYLGAPVTLDVMAQKTGSSGVNHYDPAAHDASSPSRFAYSEHLTCEHLHVADWSGGIVQHTTLQPYGRFPTWVGGKILAEGYKAGKRWTCEATDRIVEIDPNGGPAVELITGSSPDGR